MSKKVEPNLELTALFLMLKDHGASHVVITFSGSGDSGAYDEMHAVPQTIVDDAGNLTESTWSSEFDEAVKPMAQIPGESRNLLETLAEGNTDAHDWWNNDGGDGYIVVNMTDLTFHTHYAINHTNQVEHDAQGKIEI